MRATGNGFRRQVEKEIKRIELEKEDAIDSEERRLIYKIAKDMRCKTEFEKLNFSVSQLEGFSGVPNFSTLIY